VTPAAWIVLVTFVVLTVSIGILANIPSPPVASTPKAPPSTPTETRSAAPSLALRASSACVDVDEFNETARYIGDDYSMKDGLRLRDMDPKGSGLLSATIVLKQMNARGRGACRDLDALFQHKSAEMLRQVGLP